MTMTIRKRLAHQCPQCGAREGLRAFKNATLRVTVKGGLSGDVAGLSGFRCAECGYRWIVGPQVWANVWD